MKRLLLVLLFVLIGCGSDPPAPPPKAGAKPAGGAPGTPGTPGGAKAAGSADAAAAMLAAMPPLPVKEFQEKDFAETDQSRDPFRSFASAFMNQAKAHTTMQRRSLVDRYGLDELKLVGVVTRAPPRALISDPTGFGWIAKVGDFVGKSELVHAGGPAGFDVAVNWRVDRIRTNDVVFIREDPSHPEIPPTTRVLALRTAEEESKMKLPQSTPIE